jgi:hypothetical protein
LPNESIRRYEFDIYRSAMEQRVQRLEQELKEFKQAYDTAEDAEVEAGRDRKRWTWQQMMAVIGTAAVLGGLWLQALAARH